MRSLKLLGAIKSSSVLLESNFGKWAFVCRYFVTTKLKSCSPDAEIRNERVCDKVTKYNVNNKLKSCFHCPVMVNEVLDALQPQTGQIFVDMTFGAGGHSETILRKCPGTKMYALDRDPLAYELAKEMSQQYKDRLIPMLGRFSDLDQLLAKLRLSPGTVDGILFDVGVSSMQMGDAKRGFALSQNGPLDMRMDGERVPQQVKASDVINSLDEQSLTKIFKVYGEEKLAPVISRAIIDARFMFKTIETTAELSSLVEAATNRSFRLDKLKRRSHTATKIFQALRIFVNNELNELNYGLETAHTWLKVGGCLVAITFHSLEDRIVKRHIMGIDMDERICSGSLTQKYKNVGTWYSREEVTSVYSKWWTPVNKKVIVPSEEEVAANPRSRSAKLRAAHKN